jgi:hypothetical protein
MHLAALLAAIAPFSAGQPGAPFPPDFSALLTVWARLVYGEAGIADLRSVHVSALMLYHWRSLLRYLRLCLQGAAALGASSTAGSSSACPMPVSAASGLIQGLLHLLQHDSVRSQFTQEQYARVTSRFQAFIAVLQGLPLTPTGHAAAVGNFSSSAVAAVMEAVQTVCHAMQCSSGLTPAEPSSALAITTALSLGASAGSSASELSMSQQQLLSMVRSSLVNTGALSKQQLEAVQGVMEVLRCQVVGGSDQYEVGGEVMCCSRFAASVPCGMGATRCPAAWVRHGCPAAWVLHTSRHCQLAAGDPTHGGAGIAGCRLQICQFPASTPLTMLLYMRQLHVCSVVLSTNATHCSPQVPLVMSTSAILD